MNPTIARNDRNVFAHLAAFLLTAVVLLAVGLLITRIPQHLDEAAIRALFNVNLSDFYADGTDRLAYISATLLCIPVYAGFFLLFRKFLPKLPLEKANKVLSFLELLFVGLAVIAFLLKFPVYPDLFARPEHRIGDLLALSVLALLLTAAVFAWPRLKKRAGGPVPDLALKVLAAAFLIGTAWLYVAGSYYQFNPFTSFHFEAYYYPVYKVFSGQTPLVDFSSLYGFYPYFLVPVLSLFSTCSMQAFSILMALLVLASLASVAYTLFTLLENKVLAFIGTLGTSFMLFILPIIVNSGGFYLQYQPHRLLTPLLLVGLCTFYATVRSPGLRKAALAAGYLFSTFAILWNIDTGAVVLAAWVAFHLYRAAYRHGFKEKVFYVQGAAAILAGIGSVLLAAGLLLGITYARTGVVVDLQAALASQTLFFKYGFYMLPTPFLHPWLLLVFLYGVALAKAIRNLRGFRTEAADHGLLLSSMYFLLPVLGLGIYSYYNGRSHDFVFLAVVWPGVLLLLLFCQEYLKRLSERSGKLDLAKAVLGIVTAALLAATGLLVMLDGNRLTNFKNKSSDIGGIADTVETLRKIRVGDEPLDLVMFSSATIYQLLGEKMTVNIPAVVDWFTKEDYRKVFDALEASENKVAFDRTAYDQLMYFEKDAFTKVLEGYKLTHEEKDLLVFVKIR